MKIKFRYHRGGFIESMATAEEFNSITEMKNQLTLRKDKAQQGLINIQYYDYDDRLEAETFVVVDDYGVMGFMWFE